MKRKPPRVEDIALADASKGGFGKTAMDLVKDKIDDVLMDAEFITKEVTADCFEEVLDEVGTTVCSMVGETVEDEYAEANFHQRCLEWAIGIGTWDLCETLQQALAKVVEDVDPLARHISSTVPAGADKVLAVSSLSVIQRRVRSPKSVNGVSDFGFAFPQVMPLDGVDDAT